MNSASTLEIISTALFFLAIFHTFLVSKIEHVADRLPQGSMKAHLCHFLAEVEVVFGLWSLIFLIIFSFLKAPSAAISYVDSLNYTEPAFVFVIMCIAATKPIIGFATNMISGVAVLLPFDERKSFYLSALVIGPVLGSLITEPAAMTVTALILLESFYKDQMSLKFKYATLALLFVNISIGGTLTHFAAPPVLMVASKWGWGTSFMIGHFGYKALIAILLATALYVIVFKRELHGVIRVQNEKKVMSTPSWITLMHLVFLFLVVYSAHHPKFFIGIFCFFLGFVKITEKFQDSLKIKTSFLVAFFLAGLVTLGGMQAWWLGPLLGKMSDLILFLGATALTAITDNAALTYLGSLVDLSEEAKYALVAGAVAGGGLTVIANAPNPAGFGILKDTFGPDGINPMRLFLYALIPTIIACLCLLFLPNFNF